MSADHSTGCSSVLQQRKQLYGPNAALNYDEPIVINRGQGCYLYDDSGNEYLDCVNNVTHVGHGNERVTAAIASQLCQVNTNCRYLNGELTAYCQELTDTLPDPLKVVYLVNSGSEANDLALRIATAAAAARSPETPTSHISSSSSSEERGHVIVMAGAYHGHLSSLIPLSPYKFWGCGGGGKPDWVHVMPCPDTYRGVNLDGAAAAARACLAEAAAAGGRVVAFFAESIISCGGQIMLPPGYLSSVYDVMHEAGVVCVADEVQTGFGRVGDTFWAFQQHGVVPDIVTMGKPMGNGFPIGGLVTNPTLAQAFAAGGMEYFNTYGGCNAAVAAGRAVLREIKDQQLQQHAADVGKYLISKLQALQNTYPHIIGDIRGTGLFVGLDIVTDPISKTPAPMIAKALKEGAKARRVLLSADGPVANVIKIKPPMVFGRAEVDTMVQVVSDVLSELTSPVRLADLLLLEQQHWQQQAAQITSRYAQNEISLQQIQQKGPAPAAAAAENMVIDRVKEMHKSSSSNSSSSSIGSLIVEHVA